MRRKVIPAVVGVALVLSLQGAAWAPRVHGLPNYEGPCSVDGEPGTFRGAVFVRGYATTGDSLLADVSLTGTCTVGTTEHTLNDSLATTSVGIEKSTCNKLVLRLGTATSDDVVVDLSATPLASKATKDDRAAFCALARFLRSDPSMPEVVEALSDFFS